MAKVVLPSPGGPISSTWSIASSRRCADSMAMERISFTFVCPVNSFRLRGRRLLSNCASSGVEDGVTMRAGGLE